MDNSRMESRNNSPLTCKIDQKAPRPLGACVLKQRSAERARARSAAWMRDAVECHRSAVAWVLAKGTPVRPMTMVAAGNARGRLIEK